MSPVILGDGSTLLTHQDLDLTLSPNEATFHGAEGLELQPKNFRWIRFNPQQSEQKIRD